MLVAVWGTFLMQDPPIGSISSKINIIAKLKKARYFCYLSRRLNGLLEYAWDKDESIGYEIYISIWPPLKILEEK